MASLSREFEIFVDRPGEDVEIRTSENFINGAGPGPMSRPVAIVGMHRSGTSMVAKLLQNAGLNLGDEADLMPPAAENPEGFYEHLEFVRLNDEVLNVAGAGWDCPPVAGFDWDDEALDPFRERARQLAAPLRVRLPWGWKDPRTSLTLPFWRSALGPLRIVIVVRNPLEVVDSLYRRNGFSAALALTLWQIYAERVLENTPPDERLVTHFDSYFLDPDKEIIRVLEYLGLSRDQDLPSLRMAAIPALRHHRKSVRDLEEHGFPGKVIDLYLRLCREAEWMESLPGPGGHRPQADSAEFRGMPGSIALGAGRVDLIRVENEILKRNRADYADALARHAEELIYLRGQVATLTERLSESERNREISEIHERELRLMLTNLQAVQLQRDREIMGTLGAVLSRSAPSAPAAIYYRKLVGQVQQFVETHVPSGARMLVITHGDEAMLLFGDRATESFPRSTPGVLADYTDMQGDEAISQLESLRNAGAEFLLVPSPALAWLASHPEIERHLEERYVIVARERGIGTIYALTPQKGRISA